MRLRLLKRSRSKGSASSSMRCICGNLGVVDKSRPQRVKELQIDTEPFSKTGWESTDLSMHLCTYTWNESAAQATSCNLRAKCCTTAEKNMVFIDLSIKKYGTLHPSPVNSATSKSLAQARTRVEEEDPCNHRNNPTVDNPGVTERGVAMAESRRDSATLNPWWKFTCPRMGP